MVYHDFSVINCIVRDLLEQDVSRIVVNDYQVYEELREFFRENNVNYPLRLLEDDQLKAQYNLTAEIERALKRRVWLKNGGFLVILWGMLPVNMDEPSPVLLMSIPVNLSVKIICRKPLYK